MAPLIAHPDAPSDAPPDAPPSLSVVVVSFSEPASLDRCLASLVEPAAAHQAEILVVRALRIDDVGYDAVRRRFSGCRWMTAPAGETVPRMRWLGMSAARGDVVALTEDDCVVDAQWCGAVIRAHREPWVAVGGAVEPGPYTRASDWAVYFFEYGRFMLPFDQRESSVLPGNNVSYKRRALAEKSFVETEGFYEVFVHEAWRRQGLPMLITPTLIVTNRHTWPRSHVTVNPFHHGRGFAARRVARQSWLRRGMLALLAPLLPLLQVYRIIRLIAARGRLIVQLVRAIPWFVVFGTSWAAGELVGYLFGPGKSAQHWR
ncbi:MAG: glycosyltransferase [Acidobacteriota bacterium]